MIDWADDRCRDWGKEYLAREFLKGAPRHLALAQLPEWDYVHSPDGFTESSAEVSAAVFRMRLTPKMEDPYRALLARSLFPGPETAKAQVLGWSNITFWRNLHSAHAFICARIEQPVKQTA